MCPITLEIMRDPVIASDGHTYEREALLRWLKMSNNSPATGAPLYNRTIIPNYCVKMLIRDLNHPHARELIWLWRFWHAGWWLLSHVPAALGRAGLALLLFLHISDAPEWLVGRGGVVLGEAAGFAGLAAFSGGALFCLAVLVADEATRVVSCALLCVCCFSCGLMAAPTGPIDEVLQLSRLLLLSGCALCCLGMYLMHSSEASPRQTESRPSSTTTTPEAKLGPVVLAPPAASVPAAAAAAAPLALPAAQDPGILEALARWRIDLARRWAP